jgi:hypothetical protein
LRGLKNSLKNCRLIYAEVSDQLHKYGDSEEKLIELLQEKGFKIEYLSEKGTTHADIKATRNV